MMDLVMLSTVTADDVREVYSGRPGCACGCRGSYRCSSTNRGEAERERGYPYSDDEVNDKQVRKVLRIVKQELPHHLAADPTHNFLDDDWASVEIEGANRVYTVYFTQSFKDRVAALNLQPALV